MSTYLLRSKVIQVVIIKTTLCAAVNNNATGRTARSTLCVFGGRQARQHVLELVLRDLAAQLARLGEHQQAVLDGRGALLLDEADARKTVRCIGLENLVEEVLAGF